MLSYYVQSKTQKHHDISPENNVCTVICTLARVECSCLPHALATQSRSNGLFRVYSALSNYHAYTHNVSMSESEVISEICIKMKRKIGQQSKSNPWERLRVTAHVNLFRERKYPLSQHSVSGETIS